ncbi:trimeric LpxA-like protein [Cladochytrium replicatum]|nr:trimeric LpxA-like protein [Cladochytrium replicatum]
MSNPTNDPEPECEAEALMQAGKPYDGSDPFLTSLRSRARKVLHKYNSLILPDQWDEGMDVLRELVDGRSEIDRVFIEPPFRCDISFILGSVLLMNRFSPVKKGRNLRFGKNIYLNFGCVVLDCGKVTFGDNVMLAPNVQIYAASHPLDAIQRRGPELALPVTIGDDVWIGGGAIILPGITIGSRSVVAAGAVVTKKVPEDVVVAGNPAKVIRELQKSE